MIKEPPFRGSLLIGFHAERQAFWRNSEVGKLLGFDRWPDVKQEDDRHSQ